METQPDNPISFASCLDLTDQNVVRIEIRDTHAKVFVSEKAAINISLSALASTLSELTKVRDQELEITGFRIPTRTYLVKESKNVLKLGMYEVGSVREIMYHPRGSSSARKVKIPFPNFVVTATLEKKLKDSVNTWFCHPDNVKFFATSKNVAELGENFITSHNPSQKIWTMPLPNFYGGANMCVGYNSVPFNFPLTDLSGMSRYFDILYDSPFNDDLSVRDLREPMSVASWIEFLSTRSEFPYESLI